MAENEAPGGEPEKKSAGFPWITLLIVVLLFLSGVYLALNYIKANRSGQSIQCASNLKNIGTALEMYSTDNAGHYPSSLDSLTPNYLKIIPTCASAGSDTYSQGYVFNAAPDTYTISCRGYYHSQVGIPKDFPQYDSIIGLKMKPVETWWDKWYYK